MSLFPLSWFVNDEEPEERREPTFSAGPSSDFASTDAYPDWFREYAVGPKSLAGKIVTPTTAMRQSAVFASVNLRGGTLAQCPFCVYKRVGRKGSDERRPDTDHPLSLLLTLQPNGWQTIMDFVQMMQMHVDLRGNAYAQIIRDGAGRVIGLIPMRPTEVTVLRGSDGTFFYDWRSSRTGKKIRLAQREVMHLRGPSEDGELGLSRIAAAKETIGISAAAEEYSAKLLARDARPSVVIKHPKKVGDVARFREQWNSVYGGSENAGRAAILEEGMEIQVMQMTNRDAQFIERINASIRDIARFFDVPGFLIGDDSKTTTFASAEQAVQMFEKFTMAEIARNWELTIRRDLLRPDERKKWTVEVSLQALQRGDFKTRTEGYQRAVGGPWMVANEARALENMPPVEGGDKLNNAAGAPSPDDQANQSPEPRRETPEPDDSDEGEE
jgi:HK97 family phage portal protein